MMCVCVSIDHPGSPLKLSGNSQRRARESECLSEQVGSSRNLSWSDGMASYHRSGKVRVSVSVLIGGGFFSVTSLFHV